MKPEEKANTEAPPAEPKPVSKKQQHRFFTFPSFHSFPLIFPRKDKPWDTDDIDHWKILPFTKEDNPHGFLCLIHPGHLVEESSFATLYPKYREKYLSKMWPQVKAFLKQHFIDCDL